jgi:hypothetical protein
MEDNEDKKNKYIFSAKVWILIIITILFLLFSGFYIGGSRPSSGPISLATSSMDVSFGYDF